MNVAVVGCGYVGLVTGVGLASVGHRVVGIEQDPERRGRISRGEVPFHEPGVPEALEQAQTEGNFRVSDDLGEARDAQVIMLCVQTPQGTDGAIDLSALEGVTADLAALPLDDQRQRVVVVRSTVVPGTVDEVVGRRLDGAAGTRSGTLAVASNPEFLREGSALADFVAADRILIGCEVPWAVDILRELYEPLSAPIVVTPIVTAELSKYASNALLATLISFSNEVARLSEAIPGADVEDVFDVLHLDRRLRPLVGGEPITPGILSYLRAGCGFGGSCLPKDVAALAAFGRDVGQHTPLLDATLEINRAQPQRLVDLGEDAVGDLRDRTVAVLGVAFKAGTDDLRDSPGLAIVDELLRRGARVVIHDPLVRREALGTYTGRGVTTADSVADAVADASVCFVTTNAEEYLGLGEHLDPSGPAVVDGRRIIEAGTVPTLYTGVGLGPPRGDDAARS